MIKKQKGLTLIELLAVIAIIAILFVLLIPSISNAVKKSKITGIMNDLNNFEKALYEHYLDNKEVHWDYYVTKEMEFLGDKSKKLNPFGKPYYIARQGGDSVGIKTYDEEGNEYKLLVEKKDGEIQIKTQGFGNDSEEIIVETEEEKTKCGTRKIAEDSQTDYTYIDVTGGVKIVKYVGNKTTAIIPCKINGKDVVEIGEANTDVTNAFRNKKMKEVVIPNTVKKIGAYAMAVNEISQVYIPDSVEEIKMWAYYVNKIENIRLSSNLQLLEQGLLASNTLKKKDANYIYNEKNMQSSNYKISKNGDAIYIDNYQTIVLGSKGTLNTDEFKQVKKIMNSAFAYMGVREMKVPSSVTTIETSAFNRNELINIYLPESLRGKYTAESIAPAQFSTTTPATIIYY